MVDELKALYKIRDNPLLNYPLQVSIKNPRKGILSTEFTVESRKNLLSYIKTKENAKVGKYRCFFCSKFFKEDKGARWLPMDKRESGDNGFGHTFVCNTCVPKEFGRL